MKIIGIFLFAISAYSLTAQVLTDPIRKGNQLYEQKKYDEAEVQYRRSDDKDLTALKRFNLGDALYKQERYEEASQEFGSLAQSEAASELRAKAYHNLGNSLIKEQKIAEGIEAYKNSLRLNPRDQETRTNLAKAIRQLQQQQQQQQQQGDGQNDENQDQQQDQNNQQQQNDQNQDQQKDQNQNQQNDQQNQQNQKPREGQISREDAERLLEALSKQEEKVQQKVSKEKMKGKKSKSEKDW